MNDETKKVHHKQQHPNKMNVLNETLNKKNFS